MDYDHLDPSGSLMEQIQALIQPPQSENQAKKTRKVDKDYRKPGRSVNHDNCDSCGEGGDLLCCDRCPCAFHLSCCDPPLEEDDIPDGEWLCIECKANPEKISSGDDKQGDKKEDNEQKVDIVEEKTEENGKNKSPFTTLVKLSSGKNPTTFSLPPELKCNTIFPGDRKRRNSNDEKLPPAKNGKRNGEEEDHSVCSRLCFQCSRTEQWGQLVQCDFCPLAFHADCVNPPLTTIPNGMWMCPNHAEHAEPGLRDPRFTKRCQAYNELRNNVSQHTIKLNFLKKVRRLKAHPAFRKKGVLPTRRRASLVPQAIKDHYSCPPLMYLPEHIRNMQEPLPLNELPLSTPSAEDQEQWLRGIINLQCDIAKHLSQTPSQRLPVVSQNTTLLDNHASVKTESNTTSVIKDNTTTSSPSTTTTTHTTTNVKPSVSSVNNTAVCNSAVKTESSNHTPVSGSSNAVPNACLSRVVTTTITTSSGGKTVTKPLTILYASPSKLAPQVNGHVTVNCSKSACTTTQGSQTSNATSVLNSSAKIVVKQERKSSLCNDVGHSQGAVHCDTGKLLNDVAGHLNNIKPKTPLEGVKTSAQTTSSSSGSGTSSNSSAKTITLSPALSSSTSLTAATKLAPASTPTKLIVLTSGTGGNIIKTFASAGFAGGAAAQLPSGTIVSLASGSVTGTGPLRSVVGTVNPGSTSLSPARIIQGTTSATSVATSSAINSICAAAGVDAFSELGKLDPRLIQVLAYQRLQQLLTQAKPSTPSPVAARKITFNGLKESLLLPQQNLPMGKTIAVLCPLSGSGPMSPMIHKCLTIGQGTDVDVCLQDYGHCNFVSEKHFCIFYDGSSKQYELINYSEHGTYVDNVLYSCDFSDKPNKQVTSTKDLDPKKVSKERLLTAAQEKQNPKARGARRTVGLGVQKITKTCNCTTSSSNLIGGSGAGWEGTALLHHGSYIKVGCMQFIFSIANHANKIPLVSKSRSSTMTSATPTKTATSSH